MLYDGKQVIKQADLSPVYTAELVIPYKDSIHSQLYRIRDLSYCWKMMTDGKAIYVILGGEMQTAVHYAMPVRNMLYDVMNYSARVTEQARINVGKKTSGQPREEFLSGFHRGDRLKPVITLVIYLGEKKWDGPLSLHEMLSTDDPTLLDYVQDYRLHLIEPHRIPDAEMNRFASDLGQLMTFIKYAGDKKKLSEIIQNDSHFKNMRNDLIGLINTMARINLTANDKEEKTNMWKAFEDMQNEAMEKGKELNMLESIKNVMLSLKVEAQQAMDVLRVPEEDRPKYMAKL